MTTYSQKWNFKNKSTVRNVHQSVKDNNRWSGYLGWPWNTFVCSVHALFEMCFCLCVYASHYGLLAREKGFSCTYLKNHQIQSYADNYQPHISCIPVYKHRSVGEWLRFVECSVEYRWMLAVSWMKAISPSFLCLTDNKP